MQKGLAQLRELTFFPRCMIKDKGLTNEELSYFKKKTQLCDRFIDEREREITLSDAAFAYHNPSACSIASRPTSQGGKIF